MTFFQEPILLRVVISYTMDDETITEMKEVEKFPLQNSWSLDLLTT